VFFENWSFVKEIDDDVYGEMFIFKKKNGDQKVFL